MNKQDTVSGLRKNIETLLWENYREGYSINAEKMTDDILAIFAPKKEEESIEDIFRNPENIKKAAEQSNKMQRDAIKEAWEKEFDSKFSDLFGRGGEEHVKKFIENLIKEERSMEAQNWIHDLAEERNYAKEAWQEILEAKGYGRDADESLFDFIKEEIKKAEQIGFNKGKEAGIWQEANEWRKVRQEIKGMGYQEGIKEGLSLALTAVKEVKMEGYTSDYTNRAEKMRKEILTAIEALQK